MNTNHVKLAAKAALSVVIIRDMIVAHRIKRAAQAIAESNTTLYKANELLYGECIKLNESLQAADARENYLREMLDRHEVPITEFDRIAMNDLTQ